MNKAKFFNRFMIFALVVTFVWPQSGQAVDFFGNESRERISYYQGYNEAMKLAATSQLAVPTTISTSEVSQKDLDALESKVSQLEVLVTGDDWGGLILCQAMLLIR